ncbi:MAG: DEAD/DEAH box helicase [Hyphomicrobium sp.]|nr:DEAD/DEAH box helicase [Hyphomicrobium sp.]
MTFPTTIAPLARALAARGYTAPTAVQLEVLNANASNRDLLVSAQTGSGKTVAFGLALGSTLLGENETLGHAASPLALVIAPTRELAMQVCRELTWLYDSTGARVVTCVGGMDARAEARQLHAGAHIVVGTPGRLRDHLERGRLKLGELKAAILDEADEMLDLGFREDLEFILDATPAERRTLLFSATLPREIENLAVRYQKDALRIETVRRDQQHVDIDYIAHRVSPQDVEHAVVNVLRLHDARAALVFCSTREAVNRYSARLAERGFSAVALSGELTQNERTQALQSLRDGRSRVLVATDVAARGLDLPDLALVIHADLPNDSETLLHRSGRTGRAGRKGKCVLIVPYNRRRKADVLIGGARLKVTWTDAPSPDEIRARDQERFLADPSFTTAPTEDELQRVRALQAGHTADEIALALVRMHDARLPAPEDLIPDTGPPRRDASERRPRRDGFAPRSDRERRPSKYGEHSARTSPHAQTENSIGSSSDAPRRPRPRHDDGREMVWFRINIGRERNADPRWLLPLICRSGGVTKAEIGVIRIEDRNTRFQIAAEFADSFDHAVRTAKKKEGHIVRDTATSNSTATSPAESDSIPPAREPAPAAARPPFKPRADKPRWRDKGKSKADGWAPRQRHTGPTPKGHRPAGTPQNNTSPTHSKAGPKKKPRSQA